MCLWCVSWLLWNRYSHVSFSLFPPSCLFQVVAGRNYKLLITLSNEETCLGAFEVTVYDHFGDLSITHWGPGMTCEQAKAMTEETELQVSDSSEWND